MTTTTTMTLIDEAVAPLKVAAQDRSEAAARIMIEKAIEQLAAAGNDLDKVAPAWNSRFSGDRKTYRTMHAKRDFFKAITTQRKAADYLDRTRIIDIDEAKISQFYTQIRKDAGFAFDLFAAKLNVKIGEVVDAKLSATDVWYHSILTVTKADGSIENWKTQQILNVSCLGTVFNQWPTRKIK